MGDTGARLMGRKEAPTTIQDSVDGILARVRATGFDFLGKQANANDICCRLTRQRRRTHQGSFSSMKMDPSCRGRLGVWFQETARAVSLRGYSGRGAEGTRTACDRGRDVRLVRRTLRKTYRKGRCCMLCKKPAV